MEFVKTNLVSLICGVVVLIALIVPVWPMGGYKKSLDEELHTRVADYTALNSLRSKSHSLPNLDPDNPNPDQLEGFPNEAVIEKGTAIKDAFSKQSAQLLAEAVKLNAHGLLVPGSLPSAANSAVLFTFHDQYKDAIANGFAKLMKVGTPPTPEQINLAKQTLYDTKYKPQLGIAIPGADGGAAGGAIDKQKQILSNEFTAEALLIPEAERTRVAKASLIYMNADALPYNIAFNTTSVPQLADVFYAQLDLWIIQDVASGILEANTGAADVTEAPVKHLIKLNIPHPAFIVMTGQATDGELTGPAPKVTDLGPLPMTTGRVSNPLYDVVQFDLTLNVEAASLPKILQTLSHNRFVTVLAVNNITAIDSAAMSQQGFIYGTKPIVQVNLRCEDLFFHNWERTFMPEVVAKNMATGGTGPGGVGGGQPNF